MSEDKKINILSYSFSAVEIPEFKEQKNKDYVIFGTERGWLNQYPDYLYSLYLKSAKHAAIIDGKSSFSNGRGFAIASDANITNEARGLIKGFMAAPNPNESLKQLDSLLTFDYELYGGCYPELIWDKKGEKIAEVNWIDFRYIRRSADGEQFFYTTDWSKTKPEQNEDFEVIPKFDVTNRTGKGILFLGDNKDVYPLPSYIGAINHIEADIQLSIFDISNISNQFQPSAIVQFFNGQPSEVVQDEIERKMKAKFSGSENAGSTMLIFSDSGEEAAQVTMLSPNDLDKQYQILEERINETLQVSHKVIDPILFGWSTDGNGFSSNADQLMTAHSAYQVTYAQPKQEDKEDFYNAILAINGLPKSLEVVPLASIQPQITSVTMEANMTQDEIRARMGLEPIPGVELNEVAEALGSLSPLVATKILDNMNVDEIRNLVGLQQANVIRQTDTVAKEFSKEEQAQQEELIIHHFESCGVDADEYEVIESRELTVDSIEDFRKVDLAAKLEFKVLDLNKEDIVVLNAVNDNPVVTIPELEDITGFPKKEIGNILEKLESKGALEGGGSEPDATERKVSKDGKETLDEEVEDKLQVKYRYTLRSDAPSLKGSSRDFCQRLMFAGKLYTKKEIDTRLDNRMAGLDVFQYRGGWYNNPSTGRNTKWCRHIWSQQIVKKK